MKTKIDFRVTAKLQQVFNEWERRLVPVRFDGRCVVCNATTYQTQGENGNWHDPDPRGMVGCQHSAASLVASEYGMTGKDVPVCYACRDTFATYQKALAIAKSQWKEAAK